MRNHNQTLQRVTRIIPDLATADYSATATLARLNRSWPGSDLANPIAFLFRFYLFFSMLFSLFTMLLLPLFFFFSFLLLLLLSILSLTEPTTLFFFYSFSSSFSLLFYFLVATLGRMAFSPFSLPGNPLTRAHPSCSLSVIGRTTPRPALYRLG